MLKNLDDLRKLPIWDGAPQFETLSGGITNINYLARDNSAKYVVRLGEDIREHQVMRFNELAASRAAHTAGISPEVKFHAPGILVLDYIESKTLEAADIRQDYVLGRILTLIKKCHRDVANHLRGPVLMFWVFHVIRDYCATLQEGESSHSSLLNKLLSEAHILETVCQPCNIVFSHNDLLAANFLDDGEKIWLIDWDYAGFNSPLFDLGGLASNNELSGPQEMWLLENYFEAPVTEQLLRQYNAMKCASLLRETMWSMVSEIHSNIEFDYAQYTQENLEHYNNAFSEFQQS